MLGTHYGVEAAAEPPADWSDEWRARLETLCRRTPSHERRDIVDRLKRRMMRPTLGHVSLALSGHQPAAISVTMSSGPHAGLAWGDLQKRGDSHSAAAVRRWGRVRTWGRALPLLARGRHGPAAADPGAGRA